MFFLHVPLSPLQSSFDLLITVGLPAESALFPQSYSKLSQAQRCCFLKKKKNLHSQVMVGDCFGLSKALHSSIKFHLSTKCGTNQVEIIFYQLKGCHLSNNTLTTGLWEWSCADKGTVCSPFSSRPLTSWQSD